MLRIDEYLVRGSLFVFDVDRRIQGFIGFRNDPDPELLVPFFDMASQIYKKLVDENGIENNFLIL